MHTSKKVQLSVRERDIELLFYVGFARMLTVEQIALLTFPGLDITNARGRLTQLGEGSEKRMAGAKLVEKKTYVRVGELSQRIVWMLTERGRRFVEQRRDVAIPSREGTSTHPQFMHQVVMLNELLVRLLVTGPCTPRLTMQGGGQRSKHAHFIENLKSFDWKAFGDAHLPWVEKLQGVDKDRRLEPDTILTVPQSRARFFIENELGGEPVDDVDMQREGSLIRKVERWESYLYGMADPQARLTHYAKQFPDKLPASVVFIVAGQSRKQFITAALQRWKSESGVPAKFVHAVTLDEAVTWFGRSIHGDQFQAKVAAALAQGLPFPTEEAKGNGSGSKPADLSGLQSDLEAAQTDLADERARVGRRDVALQQAQAQLKNLLKVMTAYHAETYQSIHEARDRVRKARALTTDSKLKELLVEPEYPARFSEIDKLIKTLSEALSSAPAQKKPVA